MQTNLALVSRRGRVSAARAVSAAAFLFAAPVALLAQDASGADAVVPLDEFVVSATRSLQDPWRMPSAVSRIDLDELHDLQIEDLRPALDREAGIDIVNTGAPGAQASIFMRGASNHQTLLLVDGVRMNDRSAAYINYLGGAGLAGVGRLEVLRGPQSTLYGSSALGGVVLIETARAPDGTSGSLALSGGSFGTAGGGVAFQHGTERLGLTAAFTRQVTRNDRPRNHFKGFGFAGRIEGRPTETILLGATYRADLSDFEEPGSRLFPSPGAIESRNHLATGYAAFAWSESLQTRVTAGLHRRDYSFAADRGTSTTQNTRKILDVQNTWAAARSVEIVFGSNYERSSYDVDAETTRDDVFAGYVSAVARPVDSVTLTAGARHDDFDSVGGATTWRVGASWLVRERTKLRATFGTGFSAPGSDDRHGVAQWGQIANPDLLPEKSRGWDAGIDHEMMDGRMTASATWFQNKFRNLFEWETIDFNTFEGRTVNRARASTSGVEFALAAAVAPAVGTRFAYTHLEARNDSDDVRLIRRPRHSIDVDVTVRASRAFLLGAGVHAVTDRLDIDGPIEDYTTVRLHGTWSAREDLLIRLRVENALDETYEEVLGYPALPRGIFGSVEWTF
ncbi:MAG: TonB-dependent receptor plug domain-containing protein [Opitutaceae bacterium]